MKYSISFLTLAGAVSGLVVPGFPVDLAKRQTSIDCDYDSCDPFNNTDLVDTCSHDPKEWDDRQVAENIWWQSGAGLFLDVWIKSHYLDQGLKPNNWLADLNNLYKSDDTDNSPVWDCASIPDGTCQLTASCEDYFTMGVADLYFINFAAMQMHSCFSTLHENLQDWAITSGFNVGTIVKEFVGDVKGVNPFAIMGAAMGMAAAFNGGFAGPGVAGAIGLASGSFGIAAQFYHDNNDPEAVLDAQISAYFEASKNAIQTTLNNAFGVGEEYDIEQLPGIGDDYYNQTPIGKFFSHGRWLMYNTNEILSSGFMDESNRMMTNGLVMAVLKSRGYFIWVNTDITSQEDCTGATSRTWVDDQCFALLEKAAVFCFITVAGCDFDPYYISDDNWNKLIDENGPYQLRPDLLYSNSYDCKKTFPDGSGQIDVGALPYDSSLPRCFYNVDVKKGPWNENKGVDEWDL